MKQIEEEDKAQVVRLGDASIASPFTSKLSTTMCGMSIVKSLKSLKFNFYAIENSMPHYKTRKMYIGYNATNV